MKTELTTSGIVFLILAWGFVLSLAGFSLYKVFRIDSRKKHDV